jgi:hypothetical protein
MRDNGCADVASEDEDHLLAIADDEFGSEPRVEPEPAPDEFALGSDEEAEILAAYDDDAHAHAAAADTDAGDDDDDDDDVDERQLAAQLAETSSDEESDESGDSALERALLDEEDEEDAAGSAPSAAPPSAPRVAPPSSSARPPAARAPAAPPAASSTQLMPAAAPRTELALPKSSDVLIETHTKLEIRRARTRHALLTRARTQPTGPPCQPVISHPWRTRCARKTCAH